MAFDFAIDSLSYIVWDETWGGFSQKKIQRDATIWWSISFSIFEANSQMANPLPVVLTLEMFYQFTAQD